MAMSGSIRGTIYPKSLGQLSTVSSTIRYLTLRSDLWRKGVAEEEASPKTDSVSTPEIARRGTPGLYLTYRILRNRNDRLHPNTKTNFSLSIYTTLVLIPVCCQRQLVLRLYIYPSFPFTKIDSPPEPTSRSHILLTRPSQHLRAAFHNYIYASISTLTPGSRLPSPSIPHHVFRPQNQIRTGNQYPIPLPIATLQPRNERLLEMLQMPTHQ